MDPQTPFPPTPPATPTPDQTPVTPPAPPAPVPPVVPVTPMAQPLPQPSFADQAQVPALFPEAPSVAVPEVPAPAPMPPAAPEPRQQLQSLYASGEAPVAPVQPVAPTQLDPNPAFENIYTEICSQIIKEQGRIIGDNLAIEQATHVEGLTVDRETLHCTVVGDGSKVINDLIEKYSDFFGHAAVEVCREAASRFLVNLSNDQTPTLLRAS